MSYNGWSNYETWNVALWFDNEPGSYEYRREVSRDHLESADGDKDTAVSDVADWLKDDINVRSPDLGASMYADLLNAAISEVNWYEIAKHWVEEAVEEAEEA